MTEPLIEQLIKAYEDLTFLLSSENIMPVIRYQEEQKLRNQITALTKDYRENRKWVNVYEWGSNKFIGSPWGTVEQAVNGKYSDFSAAGTYKETIEIIGNKP